MKLAVTLSAKEYESRLYPNYKRLKLLLPGHGNDKPKVYILTIRDWN